MEFTSAGMVTALALLVVCWVVNLLVFVYIGWVRTALGGFVPHIDLSSPKELGAWAGRISLYLAGWVLLISALARSSWDIDVVSARLGDMVLKAYATLPATILAALLTVVLVMFLPGENTGRLRARHVVACLALTALSSTVAVGLAWNFPIQASNLPMIVFLLGFVPLLICYGLFLIAAVAFGFGASRTHPRAGGINSVLLSVGLATSYAIVEAYGPIPINATDEITTGIVRPALGAAAVALLFIAGMLGIWNPGSSDTDVS